MTNRLVGADSAPAVDIDRLGDERRERVLDLMEARRVDALVLGREANARYATGLRRLPVSGSRPFAPSTVLTRADRGVRMLSGLDYDVPAGTRPECCIATSWDPEVMATSLGDIGSLASAKCVAVDFVSPQWRERLGRVAPAATFVDANPLMLTARMTKTRSEVACIRAAVGVAESSLVAALGAVRPGRTERETLGAFATRMGQHGFPAASMEGICTVMSSDRPGPGFTRIAGNRRIAGGDLVAVGGGVLVAGYEGAVGRTTSCGRFRGSADLEAVELVQRWQQLWARLERALRPGSSGADLCRAHTSAGVELPGFPIALSVGLGVEPPVAGTSLGPEFDDQWRFGPGMVLQVQSYISGRRAGYFALETVLITDDGPELLSTLGHATTWPRFPADEVVT